MSSNHLFTEPKCKHNIDWTTCGECKAEMRLTKPTKDPTTPNWEDSFNEKFVVECDPMEFYIKERDPDKLKSFIRQQIEAAVAKQREQDIEEAKEDIRYCLQAERERIEGVIKDRVNLYKSERNETSFMRAEELDDILTAIKGEETK